MVKGVEFIIDDKGKKKAVLIDLKKYGEVWEDFYDTLRVKERESEPRESLEEVKKKVLGRPQMTQYEIIFARSARKELQALPLTIAERILGKVDLLASNPRPSGCKKLRGHSNLQRIRIGEYRVIYSIDDNERIIDVSVVRHRSGAYN